MEIDRSVIYSFFNLSRIQHLFKFTKSMRNSYLMFLPVVLIFYLCLTLRKINNNLEVMKQRLSKKTEIKKCTEYARQQA